MGLLTWLTDPLRSPLGQTPPVVLKNWSTSANIQHFQRLYDYYSGDEDEIMVYTEKAMLKTFKASTIAKMQLPYFNIVRRIIDRLAIVYQVPADRYLLEDEKGNKVYQDLINSSDINSKCKVWHRLSRLLDTIYVQPVFRKDHIEYDIFPPHLLEVGEDPDNYTKAIEVRYKIPGEGSDYFTVIWAEKYHWILDNKGLPVPGKNPWNGQNLYGVLPLIPLRLRETEDHWGEGDTQLVDINEKINILLASTFYNALLQSHGQAVATNFDFEDNEEIQTGPDKIIQVKNVTKDMVAPSFMFVQPNPAIEACMAQIDWMVKTAAMMRGLSAESVSIDSRAGSGAAKAIDNWELIEQRKDDIEYLRPFEKKLFDITRVIWNFHRPEKISLLSVFGVDFEEPKAPVNELDDLKAKEMKLKWGLWTPVDDMIDEDEGITKEIALKMIEDNMETNKKLGLKQEAQGPLADNRAESGSTTPAEGRPERRDYQEQLGGGENPA